MQYLWTFISPAYNFMLAIMLAIRQQNIAINKINQLTDST